ncbi:MAG: histidine phosphatase family protein [Alphaproteobacteria bacterium]|nr:histidine phosphatase family protein [Alphaproteobacteria bacterium]
MTAAEDPGGATLCRTTFYYVRHGETDWNRDGRFQGQTDIPLNAAGVAHARAAGARVRGLPIEAICSSPLSRALETARCLQAALKCDIDVIGDLAEATLGVRDGAIKGRWYRDWKTGVATPDGAEPYDDFIERALCGVNQALMRPGPVLIVAHRVVYRAIKQHARLQRNYAGPNCVVVRHDPPRAADPRWRTVRIG